MRRTIAGGHPCRIPRNRLRRLRCCRSGGDLRGYDRLFGARTHSDYAPEERSLVRPIALGGTLLSIHWAGNGLELVAKHPTVGGADICLCWSGTIESAADLLHARDVPIIDGPSHRRTVDGLPALSVYFRDPDGNLLELMAADSNAAA